MIERSYPTDPACQLNDTLWQRFGCYVDSLNHAADVDEHFKLLFLGRHGEGWHNAAETYYGTSAWNVSFDVPRIFDQFILARYTSNQYKAVVVGTWTSDLSTGRSATRTDKMQCYYSKLEGNGTAVWADAHLDSIGIQQAEVASNFWASQISSRKIPTPQSYYVSPLFRALQTSNITFSQLDLPSEYPFIPTIKELIRESLTGHTCDRRSNTTYIHQSFPSYRFEAAFAFDDPLWKPLLGETALDQDMRSRKALDDMFRSDPNTYLSITSHSGEIASILRGMLAQNRKFED